MSEMRTLSKEGNNRCKDCLHTRYRTVQEYPCNECSTLSRYDFFLKR
jgi:hypothetical protein